MSGKTVLLTRPREDSEEIAKLLEQRGYSTVIEPMLSIVPMAAKIENPEQYRGLIFTSTNGVRVFAAQNKTRDLPVFAVGKNSAQAARDVGFMVVTSANGAIDDLVELLIMQKADPQPFLHVRGEDVSGALKKTLDALGIKIVEQVVYKAAPAEHISPEILEKLEQGGIDAVLFFSARTARVFAGLVTAQGSERTLSGTKALSISNGVLECLSVLPWNRLYVAETPDREGMIDALVRVFEERDTDMSANTRRKTMSTSDDQALENAEKIIERFGGIRPMASKINVPVTTVQGWKKRNVIPGTRRDEIIEAAKTNNIDISDLAKKADISSIANENRKEATPAAEARKPEAPKEQAKAPSFKADAAMAASDPAPRRHEELMAAIEQGDRKTMQTSTWITTALVSVVVVAGIVLMWPSKQKVDMHDGEIAVLQTEVKDVNQRAAFLKNMVPEDIQKKFGELQEQARNVQADIQQMGEKADTIRQEVLSAEAGSLSERVSALEEQFSEIEGLKNVSIRIRELEQSIAGQDQLGAAITELRTIMDGLEGRVGELDQKLSDAQSGEGALGETLEGVTGDDLKAAAMLIAFSQMRDSLNRQAPFEEDLALLQKMVGKDNQDLQGALLRLAPYADEGVLTPEGLSSEFKGLAGDIVVSSLKGEDVSVMDKAKARMNEVLKVEKQGELITGTDTQAKVARAQAMLDEGNVEGAIAELQSLDGQAAQAAQPFIDDAKVTLLAEQVQNMLRQNIMSKVNGGLGIGSGGINLKSIGRELQNVGQSQEVIVDPESGTAILPHQPGFKGFSDGQP